MFLPKQTVCLIIHKSVEHSIICGEAKGYRGVMTTDYLVSVADLLIEDVVVSAIYYIGH